MLSRHSGVWRCDHICDTFLAVGEALKFTKAAAQLRVAQPALSRQVQDLEHEIGVDLLRLSPRGVILTAEGRLFLEKSASSSSTNAKPSPRFAPVTSATESRIFVGKLSFIVSKFLEGDFLKSAGSSAFTLFSSVIYFSLKTLRPRPIFGQCIV